MSWPVGRLKGYGFDPYIAATPGNAIQALASFWVGNVSVALEVEERFADRCYLRYEDLVTGPESTAAGLFAALGVAAVPGISQACFSAERERFGPADYKIWSTSRVSSGSVGRGWSIPAAMIAPQVLSVVNELAGRLGYLAVDSDWGTCAPPADLRTGVTPPGGAGSGGDSAGLRSERLGERLRAGLAAASAQPGGYRSDGSAERLAAVAVTGDRARPAQYWL
ncbi:MAG: hypothetical protein ACRDRJ_42675, partial [Streptosporangiaceae bacterium]